MTRTGDLVVGVKCPKCRQESVVYNGNYYCDSCEWAMEENGPEYGIVKKYLIQRLLAAQKSGNETDVEAMSFHLINGGYIEEGETLP